MSRVQQFRLIQACRQADQTPPSTLITWDSETEAFDILCQRIAGTKQFDGVEHKRGNWFVIFSLGRSRYRWQMPNEETARRVERYATHGGGFAYARRKAVRSYKFDEDAGKWRTLNIKTSKKWRTQAADRARLKRKKRAKKRALKKAIENNKEWARNFHEQIKSYEQGEK